jgi:hypothetical protein
MFVCSYFLSFLINICWLIENIVVLVYFRVFSICAVGYVCLILNTCKSHQGPDTVYVRVYMENALLALDNDCNESHTNIS